ncbi:hypothetical protein CANMA_004558 [Candida margitis]|uniref:CTA9 n=1 Tax=Candida margitis TaxID=1775924 RepID=UPI002227498F|nr:CTA9 [Candida margitis]XP_051669865.1 uncharacterized protein CANMA_004558 [Candida margitis]KAI5956111.1 CTA9 [Candida margitis]KAI5956129.1 hypothetical protein CANMA_004558 [Candida margitis]
MNLNKTINRRPSELGARGLTRSAVSGNDQIKPNFIHSSDIPRKVAYLIHSISKSKHKRISEECSSNRCVEISVNIELNALVRRGSSNLLALLQRNMISVVQLGGDSNALLRQSYLYDIITNQKRTKIHPDALSTKDVFVVSFKLIISNFDSPESFILEEDENFHLLQSCDQRGELVAEIKQYIKETYTLLKNQGKSRPKNDGMHSHSDVSDSTLECSEDDALYLADENEGGIIEPLVSNETLTDEFRRRFSEISDEEKGLKFKHTFLDNIDNLRHNDDDKQLNGDEQQVLFQGNALDEAIRFSPLTPENHIHLDDLVEVSYEESDNEYTNDFQVHRFSSSSPKKEFCDDDEIMKFSRKSSFQSPTKRRAVSRMSSSHSVSMINTDDKYGLQFAYNSDSAAVPSYIKQNKKFKFIKVGKVQKFVNLFEEQNQTVKK